MHVSPLTSISTCATYSWVEGWQHPEAHEPFRPEDMPYFKLHNGITNRWSIAGTGSYANNDVFFEPAMGCFFQINSDAMADCAPPCGSLASWQLVRREVALDFAGGSTLYITLPGGNFRSIAFEDIVASEDMWQQIADSQGLAVLGKSGTVYYPVEVPTPPQIIMTPGPIRTETKVDRGACVASGVLGAIISPILTGGNYE